MGRFGGDVFTCVRRRACTQRDLMTADPLSQHLYDFAVELRRLAYTMPSGHENPLIRLSERMVRFASEQPDESQR